MATAQGKHREFGINWSVATLIPLEPLNVQIDLDLVPLELVTQLHTKNETVLLPGTGVPPAWD